MRKWVIGFEVQIEVNDMLATKLKGIQIGFLLAKDLRLKRICIEADSAKALSLVKFGCPSVQSGFQMVKQIQDLLKEEWNIKSNQVYHETNKVVDSLTHLTLR